MIKLGIEPDYKTFLNINRLYSYENISLYVLIGGRGMGKTTGLLLRAVSNYNKRGEQFVLIRRYKSEVKECHSIFARIAPEVKTTGSYKDGVYQYRDKDNNIIGWCIALTSQSLVKSGVDFNKVTLIIYDEFTLISGSKILYMSNEVHQFFELISSIVRLRDNYKIFLIGNNNDLFNPYTDYFNININNDIVIDKERGLYFEKFKPKKELLEIEEDTKLYRLTKDTSYHDYHYNNKVLLKNTVSYGVKDIHAVLHCRLLFNNVTLNIYTQPNGKIYIETKNKAVKDSITYVIMENGDYNVYYCSLLKKNSIGQLLIRAFYTGNIEYEDSTAYSLINGLLSNYSY